MKEILKKILARHLAMAYYNKMSGKISFDDLLKLCTAKVQNLSVGCMYAIVKLCEGFYEK